MPVEESSAQAVTRIAASDSWVSLGVAVQEAVVSLGGAGSSIGVLEDRVIRQSARGFDSQLNARYASIPVTEALPGPVVLRTGTPQFLENRTVTLELYPAVAPILDGGDFEAAACLPLLAGHQALGFMAAHYRGPHRFDRLELLMLGLTAAACAGAVARLQAGQTLLSGALPVPETGTVALEDFRRAMASRSSIEQAKGMLMQRFEIDASAAWSVLRRLSSVHNVKIRDLAKALVAGDVIEAVSEQFISETSRLRDGEGV